MKIPFCPRCRVLAVRVMYAGIPVWGCFEHEPADLWGFWSWPLTALFIIPLMPFNGMFLRYPPGRYWSALWGWLRGNHVDSSGGDLGGEA